MISDTMLSKGITASCLISPLKSQHDLINLILEYSADIPDDDKNEAEMIEEHLLLNVSTMSFLEETRLANIVQAEETRRVNSWQMKIRDNFANPTNTMDSDDAWDTESMDDGIWKECTNPDADWDTDSDD